MTPRATAQQAVEILKVYQLRRENATIYEMVKSLQQEISDLHKATKSIREEMVQVQTHSQTCNNFTLDNKDRIDKLTSKIVSLNHKSDKLEASLVENTKDRAKQDDEMESANAQFSNRIDMLSARLEYYNKKQVGLQAGVAEQIASLQERFAQSMNTHHISLTEDKLQELDSQLARLPTKSYASSSIRVPESVTGDQANNIGLVTCKVMTGCQQDQDETEPAYASIPTQLIDTATIPTNSISGHKLMSRPEDDTDASTQPEDIDLDEFVNDTGHVDSDGTRMALQDSLVMLPLQPVQRDKPIDLEPTWRHGSDVAISLRAQDKLDVLLCQHKKVNAFIETHQAKGVVSKEGQDLLRSQLDVTSLAQQSLRTVSGSQNEEHAASHIVQQNQGEKTVTVDAIIVAKESATTIAEAKSTEQDEHLIPRKPTKKRSNIHSGAPLRRSQRLVEKSRGLIQNNTTRSAKADATQEAASGPKAESKERKQPDKVRINGREKDSIIFPQTPQIQIIRQGFSSGRPAHQTARPLTPEQQRPAQKQAIKKLARLESRALDTERLTPSPYNPQPRLVPRKRKVVQPRNDWTSDLDVSLPPLKRQATLEARITKRQTPAPMPLQKRQKTSVGPPAKLPILSTSTEEDRRFEKW